MEWIKLLLFKIKCWILKNTLAKFEKLVEKIKNSKVFIALGTCDNL